MISRKARHRFKANGEAHMNLTIDQVASEMTFAEASGPLFGDLVSLSRRVLGDEDLARDAVQESLLSLWLGGNMPENARGWLKGAVVRRSLHLGAVPLSPPPPRRPSGGTTPRAERPR